MTNRLVIVQPYVPAYRLAFFEMLRKRLSTSNIDCLVAAGTARGSQAQREDSAHAEWLQKVHFSSISLKNKTLGLAVTPNPCSTADGVIFGLEGTSLPAYRALMHKMAGRLRVGLWGHVDSYVNRGNRLDLRLENLQMRCANHIFAYTPGGSEYAIRKGINPDKITTVMNTVDTVKLENCVTGLNGQSIRDFRRRYGIHPERTVCFLGGLDDTKRISFLAEMLDVLWKLDPTVRMIVGGRGPDNVKLGKSYARGQSIEFGYAGTREKALILASSRAICMPGRIGLVAVDALITKKPIITTDWMFHAPESEYLVEGVSKRTAPNSPDAYARYILEFLNRKDLVPRNHVGWRYPTITRMVENYAIGVEKMFN